MPTGKSHFLKEGNVIKKIIEMSDYDGWFYDITTESGTFHCGVGQGHVHNSPVRGETFVTRKITRAVAQIYHNLTDKLYIGNLDAERDWGHAKEFVEGMWLMLQQDKPDDYILATGRKMSVRKFIELSFKEINIDIVWKGEGVEEIGYNKKTGDILVKIDPQYFRPNEVDLLLGDASKAKAKLGWEPKCKVEDLVKEMVQSDIKLFEKDKYLQDGGFEIYNHYE